MAYWVVSSCHPPNKRDQYVKALQKYIQIDVFGSCSSGTNRNKCPNDPQNQTKRDICINRLALQYKFYISFENSDCKEYMTEKYYRTLGQPIIPIVMGLGDYAKDGPPNSSINVNDFTSVKALADYIKLLDRDQDAYLSYFKWKENFVAYKRLPYCELCAKLNDPNEPVMTYPNVHDWFYFDSQGTPMCRDPSKAPYYQSVMTELNLQ
jgi:hypothetical protein